MSFNDVVDAWDREAEPYNIDDLPPVCAYGELPPDYLFSLIDPPEGTWTLFRKTRDGINIGLTEYPVRWCMCDLNALIQPHTWQKS